MSGKASEHTMAASGDHEEERIAQATRNKATETRPIVTRGAIRKLGQERGAKR